MFRSITFEASSRGAFQLEMKSLYATLELKNPSARNAVSIQMMGQLEPIVEQLEQNPPLVLLIYGADTFCAGGDLNDVRRYLMDSADEMCTYMTGLLNRIQQLPTFVVACVDGFAIGGGAEIVTVADYVICHAQAKVGFVHSKLGVSPGWGGAERLIRKVGAGHALYLLSSAKTCPAEELVMRGLVHEICTLDSAYDTGVQLAERISRLPVDSVKTAIDLVKNNGDEHHAFVQLWGGPTHRTALGLN